MQKSAETTAQSQKKQRKEAQIQLYIYATLFVCSVAGLCVGLIDWAKSSDVPHGFDLVGWCGLLIGCAFGYSDSNRTLRTGNALPSFGFAVGMFIALFSNIGKDVCKHHLPVSFWPWMLGAWLLIVLAAPLLVVFRLQRLDQLQNN